MRKTETAFTIKHAIAAGLLMELILFLIQFAYLRFYATKSDVDFAFTSEYMSTNGFYIFLIIGFLLYSSVVFYIIKKFHSVNFGKILILLIAGGIVEIFFYIFIQADFEFAYVFSVLDKFIAGVFAMILYFYSLGST
jgi:hypothetical protein